MASNLLRRINGRLMRNLNIRTIIEGLISIIILVWIAVKFNSVSIPNFWNKIPWKWVLIVLVTIAILIVLWYLFKRFSSVVTTKGGTSKSSSNTTTFVIPAWLPLKKFIYLVILVGLAWFLYHKIPYWVNHWGEKTFILSSEDPEEVFEIPPYHHLNWSVDTDLVETKVWTPSGDVSMYQSFKLRQGVERAKLTTSLKKGLSY